MGSYERGHLFRYGETQPEGSFVRQLEKEMASLFGARYAVACNSGGSAIFLALAASGVHRDSTVLMNAFTPRPSPVPCSMLVPRWPTWMSQRTS